jgi:hypothetical protein
MRWVNLSNKLQIDTNKPRISIFALLLKRDFLLYFFCPATLISIIGGLIGIYLSFQGMITYSETDTNSHLYSLVLVGYVFCVLFTFLVIRIFYVKKQDYIIHRPRTILLSQGIAYFCAYAIGQVFTTYILTSPSSTDPGSLLYSEISVYFTSSHFMAWLIGGFLLMYFILVRKIDYRAYALSQYSYSYPQSVIRPRHTDTRMCVRCGKILPIHAKFCTDCAYPVGIPKEKEISFNRVSFKQALDLLDSEAYYRGTRMDIEFECVVLDTASPEKSGGPAPYRTIQVSDPSRLYTRTLHVWGDLGHRYNINLVSSLSNGDRILVIGPRRPKDSHYYKDQAGQDVFWIERWDGTIADSGTRLLKLEDVSSQQPTEVTYTPKIDSSVKSEKTQISPQMNLPPFYCQLCSLKHTAGTPRMQCEACGRFVCVDSFADMVKVARSSCPMCDGKLSAM